VKLYLNLPAINSITPMTDSIIVMKEAIIEELTAQVNKLTAEKATLEKLVKSLDARIKLITEVAEPLMPEIMKQMLIEKMLIDTIDLLSE
jgi:hypothetical protein